MSVNKALPANSILGFFPYFLIVFLWNATLWNILIFLCVSLVLGDINCPFQNSEGKNIIIKKHLQLQCSNDTTHPKWPNLFLPLLTSLPKDFPGSISSSFLSRPGCVALDGAADLLEAPAPSLSSCPQRAAKTQRFGIWRLWFSPSDLWLSQKGIFILLLFFIFFFYIAF